MAGGVQVKVGAPVGIHCSFDDGRGVRLLPVHGDDDEWVGTLCKPVKTGEYGLVVLKKPFFKRLSAFTTTHTPQTRTPAVPVSRRLGCLAILRADKHTAWALR